MRPGMKDRNKNMGPPGPTGLTDKPDRPPRTERQVYIKVLRPSVSCDRPVLRPPVIRSFNVIIRKRAGPGGMIADRRRKPAPMISFIVLPDVISVFAGAALQQENGHNADQGAEKDVRQF